MKKSVTEISDKQFKSVHDRLLEISPIFAEMWRIQPKMVFDVREETAGLEVVDIGSNQCFRLSFNPRYWRGCSVIKRLFIICHEYMHVILGHWLTPTKVGVWMNVAQDIQVNEFLLKHFHQFNVKSITASAPTVSMVFREKAHKVQTDQSSEYYYNILMRCLGGTDA